ncbi:MAG: sigma-70 family RNA polymerase sigma factor [Deltaproteobacteria bacterium]|nr:sigma-70 family RNA polymerase sigma factor [Deltaproteobacteria bacterium]
MAPKPKTSAVDEKQLIAAAQAGDRRALDTLIRRHQGQVYRFGRRLCGDPHDAEDVLQETFLAMARSLGGYRGTASLSTWLYAVARSFCIKKRRRRKDAPSRLESLEQLMPAWPQALVDPGRTPDDRLVASRVQAALDHAIAGLDPKYREVLVLRDIEGLTAPEVGDVLGLTIEAVKSRLHRAREQVRRQVAPALDLALEPASGVHCRHTARLLSRHLEGEIDAATCARMEQHVATCPRCAAVCRSLRQTLAACRTSGAGSQAVPREIQRAVKDAVRAYLDGAR